MIIEGNGHYGNIRVETKEKAIHTVLHCLNNYQIGWNVIYVEQLLKEFDLKKEDFKLYEASYYHGAYSAYYIPNYTMEELEEIRKKHEEEVCLELIREVSKHIQECVDQGMQYDEIRKYINMHDLRILSKITTVFMRNTNIDSEVEPFEVAKASQ